VSEDKTKPKKKPPQLKGKTEKCLKCTKPKQLHEMRLTAEGKWICTGCYDTASDTLNGVINPENDRLQYVVTILKKLTTLTGKPGFVPIHKDMLVELTELLEKESSEELSLEDMFEKFTAGHERQVISRIYRNGYTIIIKE